MAERRQAKQRIFEHETENAQRWQQEYADECDGYVRGDFEDAISGALHYIEGGIEQHAAGEARCAFALARELERRGAL